MEQKQWDGEIMEKENQRKELWSRWKHRRVAWLQ